MEPIQAAPLGISSKTLGVPFASIERIAHEELDPASANQLFPSAAQAGANCKSSRRSPCDWIGVLDTRSSWSQGFYLTRNAAMGISARGKDEFPVPD
jgi:hypothetical protein